MFNKDLIRDFNLLRTKTIMDLDKKGYGADSFYVIDTNKFVDKFIDVLNKIDSDVTIDILKDLTERNNEGIFLLMKEYSILDFTIETLCDFNMRYCHFFNSLTDFLDCNSIEINSQKNIYCKNEKE